MASETRDWTRSARGNSNSSPEFLRLVDEVAGLIRSGGGMALSESWAQSMAQLILAQLAHGHNFGPLDPPQESRR